MKGTIEFMSDDLTYLEGVKLGLNSLLRKIKQPRSYSSRLYRGKIFSKDAPKHPYFWFKYKINDLRYFLQRGLNGYSEIDIYNIDLWFKHNIVNLLHDMIVELHGYPVNSDVHSFEEWKNILKTMYFYFKESDRRTCKKVYIDNVEYRRKLFNEGMKLFCKYYNDLWI